MIVKEIEECPHCHGCGREAGHFGLAGRCQWCKGTGEHEIEEYVEDEEEER